MSLRRRSTRTYTLGIAGLTGTAQGMLPGQLYAALIPLPQAAKGFLAATVAGALNVGGQALAILNSPVDEFLTRLTAYGINADIALTSGKLIILKQSADYDRKLARYGAQHFVDELDHHGAQRHCLVVIECAEHLFSSGNEQATQAQARIYQRWFSDAGATGLLLFQKPTQINAMSPAMRMTDDHYAGLACFRSEAGHFFWQVEHWRSPLGSISRREYNMGFDDQGALFTLNSAELSMISGRILQAPDQDRVIVTKATISGEHGVPVQWRSVEDLGAMLQAADGAIAATCLLAFHDNETLHALARTVHQLRRNCGRGLLIVVRERTRRLRYHDELLLLRLGANTVVYAEVGFSRFISMTESLRGQTYEHDIPDDFEAAAQAALPPSHCGYLTAPEFCGMLRNCLAQSARIGIESVLLRLYLLPETSHLEALRACRVERPGDLFTADGESLWLFFYACREPDVDATLARIYAKPLEQMFESHIRYFAATDILGAISRFETELEVMPAANFSEQLASISPMDSAAASITTTNTAAEAVDTSAPALPLGRLAQGTSAAPRSVRRWQLPVRERLP